MTYSDSILKLENILENLQSLASRMENSSGIHQIDIDLLQQKTRELYEQILSLEPVSFNSEKDNWVEKETTSAGKETSVPLQESENIAPPLSEEEIIEEEEIELEEEPVPVVVEVSKPKTTLDLFANAGDESLGAALSHQSTQPNLGEKLEHAPVGDLREAIGINDKFQFINELFNGDMDQYNKVLDELNSFASLQGALTYLSELSVQYDFQKTGMAFQRLKALLNKKYA